MRKKLLSTILIIVVLIITSCLNQNYESENKIQIWYYTKNKYEKIGYEKIIDKAKKYSEENDIPLEVITYDSDTLTIDDYLFKRNLAISKGNAIILEQNLQNLYMMSKHHADYENIDNYNKLLDAYKNRYFIPLSGVLYAAMPIINDSLDYYEITPESRIMTYSDYLELKQTMKTKGAKFTLSRMEFFQLIDYHMHMMSILFLNEDNKILNDMNNFKETLKAVCINVCKDISFNYDANLGFESHSIIYDENSNLLLSDDLDANKVMHILNPSEYTFSIDIIPHTVDRDPDGKSYYIIPFDAFYNKHLYMFIHKNISNTKIYDLANHLISEDTYFMLNSAHSIYPAEDSKYSSFNAPIFKIDKSDNVLNDNLELTDKKWSSDIRELVSLSYDILVKNEDKLKEIANEGFSNKIYYTQIRSFIGQLVENISNNLLDGELSLENINFNDEKTNKLIDEKINEFVINFLINK